MRTGVSQSYLFKFVYSDPDYPLSPYHPKPHPSDRCRDSGAHVTLASLLGHPIFKNKSPVSKLREYMVIYG